MSKKNNRRSAEATFYGLRTAQLETSDFSAVDTSLRLWRDGIPLKQGDTFPDEQQKQNAIINKTCDYFSNGRAIEVAAEFIEDLSAMDPTTEIPTAHITSNLNMACKIPKNWQLLLTRCFDNLKIRGEEQKELFEHVFKPVISKIVLNMFTCCDRATVITKTDNRHIIKVYDDKNILLFRTREDERVITKTNLVINDEGEACELQCWSYLPDGTVEYDLFDMNGDVIGERKEHTSGSINSAAVFRKNGSNNSQYSSYGLPELVDSISPILALIRAFSSFTTLIEYAKEMTRVVPPDAKDTDDVWDMTTYFKGGTVTPPKNSDKTADSLVAYKQPKVDWPGIISAIKEAENMISSFSGLSGVLLGTQTISGNDSGKAILLSCIPTISLANGYIDVLVPEVREIIFSYMHQLDETIRMEDIELVMNNPKNVLSSLISINEVYNGTSDVLEKAEETEEEESTNSSEKDEQTEEDNKDLALSAQTIE